MKRVFDKVVRMAGGPLDRLSETLDDAGELRLLTDGRGLFLRTRQGHLKVPDRGRRVFAWSAAADARDERCQYSSRRHSVSGCSSLHRASNENIMQANQMDTPRGDALGMVETKGFIGSVEAADAIATLEAMKMEHAVPTSIGGIVAEVRVRAGDQVARGDVLAVVEP